MIPPIRIMRWYFLIQISKEEIKLKRTLPGGLIVPDTDKSGEHSLCYGTIVQIGKDANGNDYANKNFPEAQVGDTAILHHWVEAERPIYEDKKFIYVLTRDDNHNIKGVEKPNGHIIVHPSNIFCFDPEKMKEKEKEITLDMSVIPEPENWNLSENGLFLFAGQFESDKNLREKIEEIETHSKYISDGSVTATGMLRLADYQKEGDKLTRQLNKRVIHELMLVFIHPETEKRFCGIEQRDHIFALGWMENKGYELKYKGIDFILIKTDDVLFGLNQHLIGQVKINNIA